MLIICMLFFFFFFDFEMIYDFFLKEKDNLDHHF